LEHGICKYYIGLAVEYSTKIACGYVFLQTIPENKAFYLFVGMEAFKTSVQTARDNSREISRIGVNSSKTLEQVSRDTAATTTTTSFP
jgi:hypothetical protein